MPIIKCTSDSCRWNRSGLCGAAVAELTFHGGDLPVCTTFHETQNNENQAIALLQEAQAALPDAWLAKPDAIKDLSHRISSFLSNCK